MNILWIEDFGGHLSSGTDTLESMFGGLLRFDEWDEDELSLTKKPKDLEQFCEQQESTHSIYLCRHYFDYIDFKKNHSIIDEIDVVIIDIRLDNLDAALLHRDIPEAYSDKKIFHKNAGFYIFNDLIYLGMPVKHLCFMTGEKNSFKTFAEKCTEIYIPQVTAFEKTDTDYKKLRNWVTEQDSDYVKLRRGVIEGCQALKAEMSSNEYQLQFRHFIKTPDHEISNTDIENYLDTLAQFLPLKEPSEPNGEYRLFLRTLAHEWEENISANSFKKNIVAKLEDIYPTYTFGCLMKMTRNWVSHATLLEPLNPQFIAFLFLINMRAIFKLPPEDIQHYEAILLSCISKTPIKVVDVNTINTHVDDVTKNMDEIIGSLKISEYKEYNSGKPILNNKDQKILKDFGDKINAVYRQNTGNPDAETHDFQGFLLQYFWINQAKYLDALIAHSDDFLPTLARHIYKRSFS